MPGGKSLQDRNNVLITGASRVVTVEFACLLKTGILLTTGHLRWFGSSARVWATVSMAVVPAPLLGQEQSGTSLPLGLSVGTIEVIQLAMFVGAMAAAMLSAVWLIRERSRIAAENVQLHARVAELNSAQQRFGAMLDTRDQRSVIWNSDKRVANRERPELLGTLPAWIGAPEQRGKFLAFGCWLKPQSAHRLDRAIWQLREKAEPFELILETSIGKQLEVIGKVTPGFAIVRFVSLAGIQDSHARITREHRQLLETVETVQKLANILEIPIWLRDRSGGLQWVNRAYAKAVNLHDSASAIDTAREFLPTATREEIAASHGANQTYQDVVTTVIDGNRHFFAVTDVADGNGSAGIAIDISENIAERREHERTVKSHAETLDQLTTAVAIFDSSEKLRFFNQALQKLWELDLAFLESAPENALLLDRLRSEGKLAEQPEWRNWKETVLRAYRAVEPQEHLWHLPDGRTLRVLANPHPNGGVTWIFENLTEKIDLESRYNAAVKVQGETLDNLAEGVAVFGPDGRLRLSNPSFGRLWNLPEELCKENTHISQIRAASEVLTSESPWPDLAASVTGFDDEREMRNGKCKLVNGTILNFALIPLPNGQLLTTFVDMTDSFNIERALKDKNEALQWADRLKNDFVQHVSYELRSPLTNIIGFTELMNMEDTGPLNRRQKEYVDHISTSSSTLLTIVNDILDLATVDAGIMTLDIGDIDVASSVHTVAELITERLREDAIELRVECDGNIGKFRADENRVHQVLFKLLNNAANYAPRNSTIVLSCKREKGQIVYSVHDTGPGMPMDVLEGVFTRFEQKSNGGRRRGAGLGLAIVKSFVELHGGTVEIETGNGNGTTVSCRFPQMPRHVFEAAE